MDAKLDFVSVGANRYADCADWDSKHEILAYGGGSLINLWASLVCVGERSKAHFCFDPHAAL